MHGVNVQPRRQSHTHNVSMSWDNLCYEVDTDNGPKQILRGLTGTALPNRLLAIMGGSGAGKTTFLNAISDRLLTDGTHRKSGRILLNSSEFQDKYRSLVSFVTQDDVVFDMATPHETFRFSAIVRKGLSPEEADVKVEETLQELGLEHVKHQIIGTPGIIRGLSGGERKRTNIGVELITDPAILMLDEPTSGLDSFTAEKVMRICRDLAHNGQTVICTIHQPSADIVELFDDLMLMAKGKTIYHGPAEDAFDYFKERGFECPDTYTTTDYYMVLMQTPELHETLITNWEKYIADIGDKHAPHLVAKAFVSGEDEVLNAKSIKGAGYLRQMKELTSRSFFDMARNRFFLGAQLGQALVVGLVVGIIYLNLGDDQQSVQDRMGLLFMISANVVFSSAMGVVNTFAKEKAVFIREQQSGAYSVGIYFLGKSIAELPFSFLFNMVSSVIIYFMSGLHRSAESFFMFFAIVLLGSLTGVSLGLCISAVAPNFHVAAAVTPMTIIPMLVVGGLLVSTKRVEVYWVWLLKLSIIRYVFLVIAKSEFGTMDTITCDVKKFGPNCATMFKNGTQVLDFYGFTGSEVDYWVLFVSLIALFVFFRLLAVLGLYRIAGTKI